MLMRDPIHGDVVLRPLESQVLDWPVVQRLRGIAQLGTASFVFPGCTHTRFNHSIGVNAAAARIIDSLRQKSVHCDPALVDIIGAAALLHDITHLPFGHTLEDERCLFTRHDKGERMQLLLDGTLGAQLDTLGIKQAVAATLGVPGYTDAAIPPWAREIIASTLDADLLDYLRRDAYFAGLAATYDDRIFQHFIVADDHLAIDMTKHGMERTDARSETIQILRTRYFLTERIYYHHTKVVAGAMISKAVELAQEYGMCGEQDLWTLNDWQLWDVLRGIPRPEAPDPRISRLIDRLTERRLLKRGYVLSAQTISAPERKEYVERYHTSRQHRAEAEQRLARELGCDSAEVIVYCPALTMMKEAAVRVLTPHGVQALNALDNTPHSETSAIESRYAALWRFYVFVPAEHQAQAATCAAELFGHPSEHRVKKGEA